VNAAFEMTRKLQDLARAIVALVYPECEPAPTVKLSPQDLPQWATLGVEESYAEPAMDRLHRVACEIRAARSAA
jgi:hypothetical protein